jgi:predicted GNAT family acetyltransferase
MPATVLDNAERSRFEVHTGEQTMPGILEYQVADGEMALVHTKVEPRFEGNGFGSMLVRAALDAARERGLRVLPHCWFARDWIAGHRDYLDLVPQERRAGFRL